MYHSSLSVLMIKHTHRGTKKHHESTKQKVAKCFSFFFLLLFALLLQTKFHDSFMTVFVNKKSAFYTSSACTCPCIAFLQLSSKKKAHYRCSEPWLCLGHHFVIHTHAPKKKPKKKQSHFCLI